MTSINNFLSEVYSEESYNFTEAEYAEVMSAETQTAPEFAGYDEWSLSLEGDVENFELRNGKVEYKGANVKRGPFVNGIEV